MITLFLCNPEASLHAQLAADTDRAWRAYELDQDLEQEEILAREHLGEYTDEGDGCDWPWYADEHVEVVDPEIIEGSPDWIPLADPDEQDEDIE